MFMRCYQWRHVVTFTLPNYTCKLNTTAQITRVWWVRKYQVMMECHGCWACAPQFENCIKGRPCNMKTIEWGQEFLPTFLAECDFENFTVGKLSVMSCAIFCRVDFGLNKQGSVCALWGIHLEEVDHGIRSFAFCERPIVRRRYGHSVTVYIERCFMWEREHMTKASTKWLIPFFVVCRRSVPLDKSVWLP